jgi:hypothetical protein
MDSAIDISTSKIDQLIRYIGFLSRFYRNKPDTHYYQMIQEYYIALRDARINDDFVVAHTIFFPVEIFHALDLVPMHLEFTGSLMSLFGIKCSDLLTEAAEMGLPLEICSAHRLIGGALKLGASIIVPVLSLIILSIKVRQQTSLSCKNSKMLSSSSRMHPDIKWTGISSRKI